MLAKTKGLLKGFLQQAFIAIATARERSPKSRPYGFS